MRKESFLRKEQTRFPKMKNILIWEMKQQNVLHAGGNKGLFWLRH